MMVEQDVIYEEIKFKRNQLNGNHIIGVDTNMEIRVLNQSSIELIDDSISHYSTATTSPSHKNGGDYPDELLYEDMNGICEELTREYNMHSVHQPRHSSTAENADCPSEVMGKRFTTELQQDEGETPYYSTPIFKNYSNHFRNSSNSSSEHSYNSNLYNNRSHFEQSQKHIYQQHQQQQQLQQQQHQNELKCHSLEDLGFGRSFSFYDPAETIYTEIVTHQDHTEEITTGRITRQSENPILQQSKFSSNKKAVSLGNINTSPSLIDECLYGSIDHSTTYRLRIRSLDRRENKINFYENSSILSPTTLSEDIYENSQIVHTVNSLKSEQTDSSQILCSKCNELQNQQQNKRQQKVSQNNKQYSKSNELNRVRSKGSTSSLYENVNGIEDIYESLSDNELWDDQMRQRPSNKPIDILPIVDPEQSTPRSSLKRGNGSFDENDYKKTEAPFSISSKSSSVTSSPRGSICDSMSSEMSSLPPRSTSPPPPLPHSRKRNTGNMSSFVGLNYFEANYLGKHQVNKAARDNIDFAVSYVAQHTNLLEMKPVNTEVSHELLRIGSNSSPWELLESFTIEDIITYDVISKNVNFLGIVAGRPGFEAYCYVLQSEKSNEIGDAIKDAFQTVHNKIQRSRSSCEINIQPEFHRFHYLVKIGSTKVRRSFHCVNDYINIVLEKENPKDFQSVSLEVLGSNVVITGSHTGIETSHSAPSILSLGVYSKDKRYFGYIITEYSDTKKERVQCHVYRAARNNTAAKIIDAISTSYQIAYAPRISDICEVNSTYASRVQTDNCSQNVIYSRSVKTNINGENQRPGRNSSGVSNPRSAPNTQINPIYDRHGKVPLPSTENERKNGRNSTALIPSTTGSQASLRYSLINSSPETSPACDRYNLSHRINNLRTTVDKLSSMNSKSIPTDIKDENNTLLIDIDESPKTTKTITPSILSSAPLLRPNPITEKERAKSLPILDFYADEEILPTDKQKGHLEASKLDKGNVQRKSKHKKVFGKFRSSAGKTKHSFVPKEEMESEDIGINNSYNVLFSRTMDNLQSSVHIFDVAYICSTVVNPPLRQKHVRDCYKQFTKEMSKAGKLSHNNGSKTIGSAVKLKINTGLEITMVDPNDEKTVIRNFNVDIFDKCILHPDPNMGCFAFSTAVPENIRHKCHLFVIPKELRNGISDVFCRIERLKKQKN